MGDLKMYRVDDASEHHHVIAESEQDALVVLVESGISDAKTVEEFVRDFEPSVTERRGDEVVTIQSDETGKPETRTVTEWIAKEGRVLFSSSVF